jgi:ribosomal S3-like protein
LVGLIKPISKLKKHLSIIIFFFQLEKILNIQIFFKFRNICNMLTTSNLTSSNLLKISSFLFNKFSHFKYQFKEDIYYNTIMFLIHLFKFKKPDGVLLANYISSLLSFLQKHTYFLIFLKRVLQSIQKVFKFNGVKILLSGKLNGFSRAQSKKIQVGCVPLQSFNFPYIEGFSSSFTRAGKIGVKI